MAELRRLSSWERVWITSRAHSPALPSLGCNVNPGTGTCASGAVVVAPEHGVRAYGGFAEVGLPLSRWFNANPKGYNAGWQLYLHAGKDQLVHRDAAMQLGLLDGAGPNQIGQGLGIPMIESEFIGATLVLQDQPVVHVWVRADALQLPRHPRAGQVLDHCRQYRPASGRISELNLDRSLR